MQSNGGNMSMGDKVIMSAIIGGTAEPLGGGKPARRSVCGGGFANGAVTGAYVMMINHMIHQEYQSQKRKGMAGRWDWQKLNNNQKAQVIIDNIREAYIDGDGAVKISNFFYNVPTGENISINIDGAIVDIGGEQVKLWITGSLNLTLGAASDYNKYGLYNHSIDTPFYQLKFSYNAGLMITTYYEYRNLITPYINGEALKNEKPVINPRKL